LSVDLQRSQGTYEDGNSSSNVVNRFHNL